MYEKSITRAARALFVIAIDQSGSMAGEVKVSGRTVTKAEMVAEVANDLIAELVERSRRTDGLRDYYDVAIIGYSGEGVKWLLGDKWVSIVELDEKCSDESEVEREYLLESGESRFLHYRYRSWIEAKASGATPMYESLLWVYDLVKQWCSIDKNRDSHPPLVFNITDGESSDCNYDDIVQVASKIKSVATTDGDTLLFNIHIASESEAQGIIFPSVEEFGTLSGASRSAHSLFNSASDVPEAFSAALCDIKGSQVSETCKAMGFNATISEVVTLLNIGSISIKRG